MFNRAEHFSRENTEGGIFILYRIISILLLQHQIKMKQS